MKDIFVHYLRSGHRISLTDWRPEFAEWKEELRPNEYHQVASNSSNIFQGGRSGSIAEWAFLTSRFFDSKSSETYGDTFESQPKFRVKLSKKEDEEGNTTITGNFGITSSSLGFGGFDSKRNQFEISYRDLHVDIIKIDQLFPEPDNDDYEESDIEGITEQ